MPSDFPDWYLPVALQGWDGSQHRPLLVLDTGELYTMLKCQYNTTLKNVKGDTDGNLTLNIKAQDLAEVVNRPKYGAAADTYDAGSASNGLTKDAAIISGKGVIYGGYLYITTDTPEADFIIYPTIDGEGFNHVSIEDFWDHQIVTPYNWIMYLTQYDLINDYFSFAFSPGTTFETSFKVTFGTAQVGTHSYVCVVYYALV